MPEGGSTFTLCRLFNSFNLICFVLFFVVFLSCFLLLSQVTNTVGPEYLRWERGIERALDDMDKERCAKRVVVAVVVVVLVLVVVVVVVFGFFLQPQPPSPSTPSLPNHQPSAST